MSPVTPKATVTITTDWPKAVRDVGFPIFVSCALLWALLIQHPREIDKIVEQMNKDNTAVVRALERFSEKIETLIQKVK